MMGGPPFTGGAFSGPPLSLTAFKFRYKGITARQCAQSLVKAGAQDVLLDSVGVSVNQIRQSFLRAERRLAEV